MTRGRRSDQDHNEASVLLAINKRLHFPYNDALGFKFTTFDF